ncbi:MAG: hypothetical protein ACPL4E_10015 [Thermoproteota archaeon]
MSTAEKLRNLLMERLKLEPRFISLDMPFAYHWKWRIMLWYPRALSVYIEEHEDGRVKFVTSPERTRSEILEFYLYPKKYRYKERAAKTEKEKRMIWQRGIEEAEMIVKDFKQREFEKYLNAKGIISYYTRKHMWGDEIARRIGNKYGFEVRFEIDTESGFFTTFDSKRMNEELKISEILRRAEGMFEAAKMFENEEMMNEYLVSIGLTVEKQRRRKT